MYAHISFASIIQTVKLVMLHTKYCVIIIGNKIRVLQSSNAILRSWMKGEDDR